MKFEKQCISVISSLGCYGNFLHTSGSHLLTVNAKCQVLFASHTDLYELSPHITPHVIVVIIREFLVSYSVVYFHGRALLSDFLRFLDIWPWFTPVSVLF